MLAWHTAVAAWMSYVSPHISLESHRSLTAVSPHGSRPSPLPAARHPILTFLLTLPLPLLSRRRTACVALEIHLEINLELTLEPTLQIGGDHPADHPADRPVDASGDPAVEIARLPPRGSSVARFAPHRSPPPSPTPPCTRTLATLRLRDDEYTRGNLTETDDDTSSSLPRTRPQVPPPPLAQRPSRHHM